MPFESTRDVLERARTFHRKLAEYYEQLGAVQGKDKVRMLLDYMGRHERRLEEAIANYEEDASRGVLNTWFKYTPEQATYRCFEDIEVKPDMTVEEVIKTALRMDNCLVELYRGMAERSVSEEVRQLFDDLLRLEQSEELAMVRSALEINES